MQARLIQISPSSWIRSSSSAGSGAGSSSKASRRSTAVDTAPLETYRRIRERGRKPVVGIVLAALKVCRGLNDLEEGREIHSHLLENGGIGIVSVASALVDMYAKCGSLAEARKVFDAIENRDAVSWTSMIQGYVQAGDERTALDLYSTMQCDPSRVTVLAALKACSKLAEKSYGGSKRLREAIKLECLEKGRQIHAQAAKNSGDLDGFVGTSLIDMYAKCGSMDEARQVFEGLRDRCVQSWNCLILRYAQRGDGEAAWDLFSRMESEGCAPDSITVLAAVKACASLAEREEGESIAGKIIKVESLKKARSVRDEAAKTGHLLDAYVRNALIDFYAKYGSLEEAHELFEAMPHRSVVSWNTMILGYAENGDEGSAMELFSRMKHEDGVAPNRVTLLAAIKACAGLAEREDGKLVGGKVVKVETLELCRDLHSQAMATVKNLDVFVESALLDLYAKCGKIGEACRMFESMEIRTMVSWNCIILGLAQSGSPSAALRYYSRMQNEGCLPNPVTFVAVLRACGALAALELGKRVQDELTLAGFDDDPVVSTSLIDFFGKCGSMVDAEKVFCSVSRKSVVTWSALIEGYSCQGDNDRVFDLFEEMQEHRVQPNDVTFLSILTACSHAGLVEKGKEFFRKMESQYGIEPRIRHYTCMVDLLGRANQLDEAVAMVKKMECKPDTVLYTTLLNSCWKWKNAEAGRFAFEEVMKIDSKNTLAYVLIANIYRAAALTEEVGEIRRMVKDVRVGDGRPGQSWWADERGRVHVFVSGGDENIHPWSEKIRAKMDSLFDEVVPDGMRDEVRRRWKISSCRDDFDDDDDFSLCGHTEKFAVACALLRLRPGTPIRVVNNYKTCEECHAATALVSKLEKRIIIVRDHRVHVFEDGRCCCGGCW